MDFVKLFPTLIKKSLKAWVISSKLEQGESLTFHTARVRGLLVITR